MSAGCPYSYFTTPAGSWEVKLVQDVDETVGHLISISGPPDNVKIECEGGHPPFSGKYNQELGRIEAKEDPLWIIICLPKKSPEKNGIKYGPPFVTGSWTAEDNGGGMGGGEEG